MPQFVPGTEPEVKTVPEQKEMSVDDLSKKLDDLTKLLDDLEKGGKTKKSPKGKKAKGRAASTPEEKAARMAANDNEAIRVFKAAGYETVEPRFNVLTYDKWLEKGRMVRKGEHGLKVGPFTLFHEDQTDPVQAA